MTSGESSAQAAVPSTGEADELEPELELALELWLDAGVVGAAEPTAVPTRVEEKRNALEPESTMQKVGPHERPSISPGPASGRVTALDHFELASVWTCVPPENHAQSPLLAHEMLAVVGVLTATPALHVLPSKCQGWAPFE